MAGAAGLFDSLFALTPIMRHGTRRRYDAGDSGYCAVVSRRRCAVPQTTCADLVRRLRQNIWSAICAVSNIESLPDFQRLMQIAAQHAVVCSIGRKSPAMRVAHLPPLPGPTERVVDRTRAILYRQSTVALVKSPKLFWRDSGVACWLCGMILPPWQRNDLGFWLEQAVFQTLHARRAIDPFAAAWAGEPRGRRGGLCLGGSTRGRPPEVKPAAGWHRRCHQPAPVYRSASAGRRPSVASCTAAMTSASLAPTSWRCPTAHFSPRWYHQTTPTPETRHIAAKRDFFIHRCRRLPQIFGEVIFCGNRSPRRQGKSNATVAPQQVKRSRRPQRVQRGQASFLGVIASHGQAMGSCLMSP